MAPPESNHIAFDDGELARLKDIQRQAAESVRPLADDSHTAAIKDRFRHAGQPGPGYVCHCCHVPGHWIDNCPHRARRVGAKRSREAAYQIRAVGDVGGEKASVVFWRLASTKDSIASRKMQFSGLYIMPSELKNAIAMSICGIDHTLAIHGNRPTDDKTNRAWSEFEYGRMKLCLYDADDRTRELPDTARIHRHSRVVCRRLPVAKEERDHKRPAAAAMWGDLRDRPAVQATPGELEHTLGFLSGPSQNQRLLLDSK